MGKLILKMIAFCALIILMTNWSISQINVLRFQNFDPCRVSHIHHHLNDYNVVFVGSSRFGRQIDTELFDSITTDLNFRSYNYSFDAAFAPTSINLARSVVARADSNLKVLIVELAPLEFLGELDPGFVARTINWYDVADFLFLFRSQSDAQLSFYGRTALLLNRVYLFIYRVFSIGEFWKRMALHNNTCQSADDHPTPLPEVEKTPELMHEVDAVRSANATDELKNYNLDLHSSSYMHALNELDAACREKRIRLLTVIAPRLQRADITYVASLAKLLEGKDLIRLNNSDRYTELYSADLTADLRHVNVKGIRPFTTYLSIEVRHNLQGRTIE